MSSFNGKNIWIIGASSGIGQSLAQELAKRGANLILSARRSDRLQDVLRPMSGNHHAIALDVADYPAVFAASEQTMQKYGRIDAMICLAAHYTPSAIATMDWQEAQKTCAINIGGTINAVLAVLPYMRKQKFGQIVMCASVAGYVGLPNAQPYSMTKAAIINFAESLRVEERDSGIDVRVINPGFVETPMTGKNNFKMPMIITADAAAKYICDGLSANGFEISFPKTFVLVMKLMRILPYAVYLRLASKFTVKRS